MKQKKQSKPSGDLKLVFWKINLLTITSETKTHFITCSDEIGLGHKAKILKKETFPCNERNSKITELFLLFENSLSELLLGKNLQFILFVKNELNELWEKAIKSNSKNEKEVYEQLQKLLEKVYSSIQSQITFQRTNDLGNISLILNKQKGIKFLESVFSKSSNKKINKE